MTLKLILLVGISDSIELCQTIKKSFGLQQEFQLQYQDADFGNDFINLSVISEIYDKAAIKVVYLQSSTDDDATTRQPRAVQSLTDLSSISLIDMDVAQRLSHMVFLLWYSSMIRRT